MMDRRDSDGIARGVSLAIHLKKYGCASIGHMMPEKKRKDPTLPIAKAMKCKGSTLIAVKTSP